MDYSEEISNVAEALFRGLSTRAQGEDEEDDYVTVVDALSAIAIALNRLVSVVENGIGLRIVNVK